MRTVSRLMISMAVIGSVSLALYWAIADRSLVTPPTVDQAARPVVPATVAPTTTAAGNASVHESSNPSATAGPSAVGRHSSDKSGQETFGPTLKGTAVPGDSNPNVVSVVEAQRSGDHPERLTLAIDPAPFDAAAFAQNPQVYLNITEPARVYQTAPAGPDAVPLVATVDHTIRISANGSTPLTVIGKPNAPISFAVLDGGSMPNGLSSITVLADAEGKATTTYTATPGTVDEVQILVGSPMTVGTLTLVVHVQDPAAISAR